MTITVPNLSGAVAWDDSETLIGTLAPSGGTAPYEIVAISAAGFDLLVPVGVETGAPTLGTPALGQVHALAPVGLATGAPTLGAPALGQTHAFAPVGLVTGAPTLGRPALAILRPFDADRIAPAYAWRGRTGRQAYAWRGRVERPAREWR